MSARVCSNCGQPLSATAHFCINCGAMVIDATSSEPLPEAETTAVPWRAREAIAVFLISLFVTLIATLPFPVVAGGNLLVILIVFMNEVALFVTTVSWARFRHKAGLRALALRDLTRSNVGVGVGVGAAGIVASQIVGSLSAPLIRAVTHKPVESPDQIRFEHPATVPLLALTAISVVLLAPLAEELFFRGFLFRGLRRWAGPGPALLMSATVFGLVHVQPPNWASSALIVPPIFVLGIMLAAIVERRGSIVPSIAAHMTFNAFGFVVLFFVK